MSDIRRIYGSKTITIPAGSSLATEPIDMRRVIDGVVEISASFTDANLGFKVNSASDGTPIPLYDSVGGIVEITGASVSKAFKLPSELYGAHWVWLWTQSGSGTDADQSGSSIFTVQVKS